MSRSLCNDTVLWPLCSRPVRIARVLFADPFSINSRSLLTADKASAEHLRLRAMPAEICAYGNPQKSCGFSGNPYGAVEDFRLEDLRSKIYPQSGTDAEIAVEEKITAVTDGAVIADMSSEVRTKAGRPQPPPAGGSATCFIAVVCICFLSYCIIGRSAFSRII